MDARAELIMRCTQKRAKRLGSLSDSAYAELARAVAERPEAFIEDGSEQALFILADALKQDRQAQKDAEFLDDESYFLFRKQRFDRLSVRCQEALSHDRAHVDARLLLILIRDDDSNAQLKDLLELERELQAELGALEPSDNDLWDDVFARPRLRLAAAIARSCLDSARYRLCSERCQHLLRLSPTDALGARLSCFIALARLEDEDGFRELDAQYSDVGSAWSHLSRALLLFKLDRLPAAKRALKGFDTLCAGAAYMLLRPSYVETYLPDRPPVELMSPEAARMAVHEADPVVVDTPDFVAWAQSQPDFEQSAMNFAQRYGFDW